MNPPNPSRTLALEYWLPLVLWLALTYYFSTDNFSAGETSGLIIPILKFLFPGYLPERLEFLHLVIRKLGHISEYFILGILTYRALNYDEPDLAGVTLRSFEFIVLAAMMDEFHQAFTMSRGASVVDVGYDGFGGLLAIWGLALIRR